MEFALLVACIGIYFSVIFQALGFLLLLLYTLFTDQCTKCTNEDHVYMSEKRMFEKCIVVSQKIKKKTLRIINVEQGFTMELGFSISYTSIPDALTVPTDG